MQQNYAVGILNDGFQNLLNRKGSINVEEMETEVNFQCCRYILENYGDRIRNVPEINRINDVIDHNKQNFHQIIANFLHAGATMFPDNWQVDKDGLFIHGIAANLSWSGMWDHLVTYFTKAHGEDFDDSSTDSTIFYSQLHRRYEFNAFKSEAKVERNVNITFFNGSEYAMISIEPILASKKAYLISREGQKLSFKGEDPDYGFVMELDAYDEIEKFTLELVNRQIRIEYF